MRASDRRAQWDNARATSHPALIAGFPTIDGTLAVANVRRSDEIDASVLIGRKILGYYLDVNNTLILDLGPVEQ